MGLFGKSKPVDPKEQVKEWGRKLRKERNGLDRQIRQIQRSEAGAVTSIKQAAKKNDPASAKVLAREVVNARKAVARINTTKANISSIEMQMNAQAAQVRLAGSLQKSTEVMKSMQLLVKVPEIQQIMQEMSKEMVKAGIIEEMLEDTMDSLDDQEELEEDVQKEVDKVLQEITLGVKDNMARAPKAPETSIDLPELPDKEEEAVEEDMEEMQSRLAALRS